MDGCKEIRLLEERVAVFTGSTKGNGIYFLSRVQMWLLLDEIKSEAQSVADDLVRDYKTKPLGLKLMYSRSLK
jgi:hypothetical protein